MAKDTATPNKTINKAVTKDISALDKISKKFLSVVDYGYTERNRLDSINNDFQAIIDRELDLAKGVSDNNIVDFVETASRNSRYKKSDPESRDTTSLFTKDMGNIHNYFQDMYKNKYLEMTDLKFISKFIPALGEAVKTTLDSIVAADDVSQTITRNIELGANINESDRNQILSEIARSEKELKLLKKLRNVVYKKTLVTGKYYIYAVAYKALFEEYSRNRANGKYKRANILSQQGENGSPRATESLNDVMNMDQVLESARSYLQSMPDKPEFKDIESAIGSLRANLPVITFDDSPFLESALEGMGDLHSNNFNGKDFAKTDINNMLASDGTSDINETKFKAETFYTSGTYIKYIESKNIVPIKILDRIVGYYHINPIAKSSNNGAGGTVAMNTSVFSTVNMSERKKEEAINNVVTAISDGIIKKFNSKFVTENETYKQMIADCIISNGLVDNNYAIQFIPADQIIEYVINEDENGEGESILANSLFPAKLLLSLLICKMLVYMNKSGNKTLAHIYKGPIDITSNNQLQRVVRMMQESNITFNDLLSPNMAFSKFTRDSNIALPTAKNGNKLVEMETMEGQQVELKTDFEDKLEQMAILGTGVPNVIMEYSNQLDFAKQIVSAHIKFAGRVASLQSDLEDPTTRLYRIIIQNSNLPTELKMLCKDSLQFKLPRPKVLSNTNNAEFIQTIQGSAQMIADIMIGQSQTSDSKMVKVKEDMVREVVISNTPFLDWKKIQEIYKAAIIDASTIKKEGTTDMG